MQGALFFGILFLIGLILWIRSGGRPLEGFEDAAALKPEMNPDGTPVIPLVSPRDQTLLKGEVKPFAEPSTALLAPPPGQLASVGTRPQSDPAMEKVSAGRIQSVLESLKGFFEREAPGLSQLGDPSVQLPMSTAKGDRGRLEDELAVLKRNPGLESSLSVEDVNGIEANLGYLQKKWRLSVNAMSGSPMPPASVQAAEGFQDAVGSSGPGGIVSWFTGLFSSEEGAGMSSGPEGFKSGATGGATDGATSGSDMKLADLEDLATKMNAEVLRLGKSATTDKNTNSRIDVLGAMKKLIDDMIKEIKAGRMKERDIPIMKEDVAKFLPVMSNLNAGINDLLSQTGVNPILNSLFSKYSAGDLESAEVAEKMFEEYARDFMKNLSYDVSFRLKYTGEAEQAMARDYAQIMADARFVADNAAGAAAAGGPGAPVGNTLNPATKSAYRGFFDQVIKGATGAEVEHIDVGLGGTDAAATGAEGKPAPLEKFSWKERSKQICEQVAARGYSPREFGCMDDPEAMKREGFSWRGYTRMICTRLGTIYDPGVPELCGCPPATWAGWKP